MKRALVLKLGAIGDVVMTLPFLVELNKTVDEVHWVGGTLVEPLVNQLVSRFIPVDERKLYAKSPLPLLKLWAQIGFRYYDTIYLLHPDKRYTLLPLFTFRRTLIHIQHGTHISLSEYHAKCYRNLIVKTEMPISYPSLNVPSPFPGVDKKTILLLPGGAKNVLRQQSLKRWPIQRYVELAQQLIDSGWNVCLIGGPEDQWVTPHFAQIPCMNAIGKTTLLSCIATIHNAGAFITHDSGPMHLAKLTATPTIALFGATPSVPFAQNTKQFKIVEGNAPCSPCYSGIDFAPCEKNVCLFSISPERVLALIQELA